VAKLTNTDRGLTRLGLLEK